MSDPLAKRAGDLRAIVGEHHEGPLTDAFVAVVCNGCGRVERAETVSELASLTEEWALGAVLGASDFCPDCRLTTRPRVGGPRHLS